MIGATCLFLSALGGFSIQEAPSRAVHRETTPEGERIVVEPGGTLERFVLEGSEILGRVVTWPAEADTPLKWRVRLSAPVPVEPERFRDVFETLLLQHDFVTIPPPEEKGGVYRITYLKGGDRATLKQNALFVPFETLPQHRGRGILLTTTIPLRHLDAQRLLTSIRVLFPDQQLELVSVLANSNTILLTAFAPKVAEIADLLKALDVPPEEFPQEEGRFVLPRRASGEPAPVPWEVEIANGIAELKGMVDALRAQVDALATEVRSLRK